MKVVEAPRETLPLTVIFAPAVNETEVPAPTTLVRFPTTVNGVAGRVFTAAPLELDSFRFPYS